MTYVLIMYIARLELDLFFFFLLPFAIICNKHQPTPRKAGPDGKVDLA